MNSLLKFILSTKKNDLWLKLALFLCLLFFLLRRKRLAVFSGYEGFQQDEQFIVKRGGVNVYDDFYAPIYDTLNPVSATTENIVDAIVKNTQADEPNTHVLNLNAKNGGVCRAFHSRKIKCVGVEKYGQMAEYTNSRYGGDLGTPILCSGCENTMEFENGGFSHVVCLGIDGFYGMGYQKRQILLNVHRWLKNGGYFVVYLVDRKNTNILGSYVPVYSGKIMQQENVKNLAVDYGDFEYKCSCGAEGANCVVIEETFRDKKTGSVRKNEMEWEIEDLAKSVAFIESCGFIQKGEIGAGGAHVSRGVHGEHIYIFQKADVVGFL